MPDEFPPTPDCRPDHARSSSDDRPSPETRPSRRSFLAGAGSATASLAATAGLGATAGCVELLPAMGQETRYESVDLPEAGPPSYREWTRIEDSADDDVLVDTVAIPNNDSESVSGVPMNYGRGFIASTIDYFGIGYENYDLALSLRNSPDGVLVLEGPIAPDEVGPTLLDSGYETDGRERGYDRFVREDVPRTVAVQDGRILFGKGPERDAAIDRALDARAADGQLDDEATGFVRLTDRAGLRPFLMAGPSFNGIGDDYPIEWHTSGVDFDEDGFYFFYYLLFANDRPSRDELENDVESMDVAEDADAVEIERDGQLVAIEMHLSSAAVESELGPSSERVPQITWGVEDDSGTIEIRHEAGEATPAEYLAIRDGWMDDPALPTQFADEYTTVGPGATVRVDRDEIANGPLTVRWEDDETNITLLEYRP